MAFISNHDRNKEISKLVKGNALTKWILLTTLLSAIVLAFFLFLTLGAQFEWFPAMIDFKVCEEAWDGSIVILWPGYILVVLIFIVLVFGAFSIFLVFRMKSNRNVASRAVKLSRSALPGRKYKISASSTVRDRVTQH